MKPIQKAILIGIVTLVVYLLVVVITTPALEPLDAISAAFQLNSIVIIGMGIGIGYGANYPQLPPLFCYGDGIRGIQSPSPLPFVLGPPLALPILCLFFFN